MNRTAIVAEELSVPPIQTQFAFAAPAAMTVSSGDWTSPGPYAAPPPSNGYLEPTFTDHLNLSEFSDSFGMFADDSDIGSMVSIGQSFSSFQSESASSPSQDDDILEAILRENGLLPPAPVAPAQSQLGPLSQSQYSPSFSQPIFDATQSQFYDSQAQPPPAQMPIISQVVPQQPPPQQQMEYSAPIIAMQQHHQQHQPHPPPPHQQPLISPPRQPMLPAMSQSYSLGPSLYEPVAQQSLGTWPAQSAPPPTTNPQYNAAPLSTSVSSLNSNTTTSASDLLSSAISSHFSSADLDSFGDSAILKNILDTDLTGATVPGSDMMYNFDSLVPMDGGSSSNSSSSAPGFSLSTEYSSFGPTTYYQQSSMPQSPAVPGPMAHTYQNSWSPSTSTTNTISQQGPHKQSPLSQLLFSTPDSAPMQQSLAQSQADSSKPLQPPPRKSALLALLESEMSPPSSPPRPFSPIHNSLPFNSSSALSSGLNTAALNSTKKF